jgi:hypothetical protein
MLRRSAMARGTLLFTLLHMYRKSPMTLSAMVASLILEYLKWVQ